MQQARAFVNSIYMGWGFAVFALASWGIQGCASGGGLAPDAGKAAPQMDAAAKDATFACVDGSSGPGCEFDAGERTPCSTDEFCNDNIDCTEDSCSPEGFCEHVPVSTTCDDDVLCNGKEVCDLTLGCIASEPETCDDGASCTTDSCNTESDACENVADHEVCNDSLACNGLEQCDPSAEGAAETTGCVSGEAVDCSDGTSCTTDRCIEPTGECEHGGSDSDGDGYIAHGCGEGNDCDDLLSEVHPGASEVCDGMDSDCSGAADDGPGMECALGSAETACTTGCGTSGTRGCTASCRLETCRAANETCNGCDDDADGTADDGFSCVRGTSTSCMSTCGTTGTRLCASDCSGYGSCVATEACNGCDDDADGTTDDGFACIAGTSRTCTTSCGSVGTQACNGTCTGYGPCIAAETCNGCDDDGDGTADDGFLCAGGATTSCTTACGTTGVSACNAACNGYGSCQANEACNACDDDADGSTDEGFACIEGTTSSCTTSCGTSGTRTCNASCSGYSSCIASAETCGNSCDDDGDGSTDEGCVVPSGDTCTGALSLSGTSGSRTDSFTGATRNVTDCGYGGEIFYRITVASKSVAYFSTFGSTFDTRISVRTSCTGTMVQCEDDDCSTYQDQLVRVLDAGTYYIAVHANSSSTSSGTVTFKWQTVPAAAGDNTRITANGTYTGSTSGTGTYSATCGSSAGGPEDAFYFTVCPSTTKTVNANTCSSASYDTVLHYQSVAGQLTCDDDGCGTVAAGSTASYSVSGDGVYLIVVDTYGTRTGGSYSLAVSGL